MTTAIEDVCVTGHCYCGQLTYEVEVPAGDSPIFTAYCHCDSCRRAHAAPLYHVACVDAAHFRITSGAELLIEFTKPGGTITRAFCGACGSNILNRFGPWRPKGRVPLAFFPNTLDEAIQRDPPEIFRPRYTNQAQECVLDFERLADVVTRD